MTNSKHSVNSPGFLKRLEIVVRKSATLNKVHFMVQKFWVGFLYATGALWWAKRQLRLNGSIVVLMFHRVLKDQEFKLPYNLPGVVVRENTFRELAEHVHENYEAIQLEGATPGQDSNKLRIAFTFDDGWTDNYSVALPVAKEFNIPFTIFVCPGLVGSAQPFWPERMTSHFAASGGTIQKADIAEMIEQLKHCSAEDRELAISKLVGENSPSDSNDSSNSSSRTLSWVEILEMSRNNVSFGSHTQTHQILTTLQPKQVQKEISLSKAALEKALHSSCQIFAYPNGNWNPQVKDIVAQEGFKLAFTTERGAWTPECDPLAIPRANVYEDNLVGSNGKFSPAMFEYTTFWKVWRSMRSRRLSANEGHSSNRGPASETSSNKKRPSVVNACQD